MIKRKIFPLLLIAASSATFAGVTYHGWVINGDGTMQCSHCEIQ